MIQSETATHPIMNMSNTNQNNPNKCSTPNKLNNHITMHSDNLKLKQRKYEKNVFIIYCLMGICWGISQPIGAALYAELQSQLNATKQEIAFCFTTRSIASVISSIITGKAVDYLTESHRYIVIPIILFITSICYLPFTSNIYVLHLIFATFGYLWSALAVIVPIYIFRLYSERKREDAGHKIYIVLIVYGITKVTFPLCIQISMEYSNNYQYPLYAVTFLCIILTICLLTFKTPKHDKLRTIKAELNNEKDSDAKYIYKTLNKDSKHRVYEVAIIVILSIIMFIFSVIYEFYTTFVAVYCNHIKIDQGYSRYLLALFAGGQLIYRILHAMIAKCKETIHSKNQMLFSFLILLILSFIFLFIDTDIVWLFIFWFLSGVCLSVFMPEIQIWSELIKPVTGKINIVYMITNAMGEIVAVFGGGVLIERYSASILKYLIFTFTFLGLLILIINIMIYAFYVKHKQFIIHQAQKESVL
eukprot:339211_1